MAWKWYDSRLIRVEDQSPTTRRFWIQLEDKDTFHFEAGQFVTMDLPIHDKRLKRWRSYSIANLPNEDNILEFCIVFLEGGGASEYLFNTISIGDSIRFKGPSGTFVLPNKIETDLVLICTGTGVAPYRSMINQIYQQDIPHKRIHLIFGTRHASGILYKEEFDDLSAKEESFSYSIALSREDCPETHKGYIHDIYLSKYASKRSDVLFYLCGWTKMIDEAVANLLVTLNYDKSQVIYELYG